MWGFYRIFGKQRLLESFGQQLCAQRYPTYGHDAIYAIDYTLSSENSSRKCVICKRIDMPDLIPHADLSATGYDLHYRLLSPDFNLICSRP